MHSMMRELHDTITAAQSGMSAEDLSRHPEGKWCAAQVLEHLYLSYKGTVRGCERCLHEGKPLARRPTLRERVQTSLVVDVGYFPSGRKAPKITVPQGLKADDVMALLTSELSAMDDAITRCEQKFGSRVYLMDHPILGPLTVPQWRKLHLLHGRHHAKQIRQLRKG